VIADRQALSVCPISSRHLGTSVDKLSASASATQQLLTTDTGEQNNFAAFMIRAGVPSPPARRSTAAANRRTQISSAPFSRRGLFEGGAEAIGAAGVAAIPGAALPRSPQEKGSELESLFPEGAEERFSFISAKRVFVPGHHDGLLRARIYDPPFAKLCGRNWIGERRVP